MDVLRVKGTPREAGRQFGEAYREGFRQASEEIRRMAENRPEWLAELPLVRENLAWYAPRFLDELRGMAQGAGLPVESILLNHRRYLSVSQGCSSVAFMSGPDGPVLGKNVDLYNHSDMRFIIRHVTYDDGREIVHPTVIGDLMARPVGRNMSGLACGAASVGSVFQKSLQHPSIDVAIYEMLRNCATVAEAIAFMLRYPYFGKGYNFVLVDAGGDAAVLECPCPLIQVRRPEPNQDAIFATNVFKLPTLLNADRRTPKGKAHAERRYGYLERTLLSDRAPRSAQGMMDLMSSCGPDGGLCAPLDSHDDYVTTLSLVCTPRGRETWVADGRPADVPYQRVD